MDTAVMPDAAYEVPHTVDDESGIGLEDTQEIAAQKIDNALREETQEIPAPEMDNTLREETPETDNAPLDVVLNDCRVEMVSLDAIYVEGAQQDDDLVNALAHSVGLIGLQNPICIVENDIEGQPAPYRLVSGRKRYAAFLKLKCPTIPAHILSYAETDSAQDVRKALATTEENLVRKHYSLIELCELVGKSKELYEQLHPHTQQGKAPKLKGSGTEPFTAPVPKPLAYRDVAAQQLGKSRATVWKYIAIYTKLIQGHHYEFIQLKQCDHPILARVEDLLALAQSPDLVPLTRLLCGLGMTPDDWQSKPRTLQEAQKCLEQHRKDAATQIAEAAHTTRETEEQSLLQEIYRHFCPEVQAGINKLPALKDNLTDLQDFASLDEECQRAILFDMDEHDFTYDQAAECWKGFASQTVEDIYGSFSPAWRAEIDTCPALRNSKRDLFELAMWDEIDEKRIIIRYMRDKGMPYAEAERMSSFYNYEDEEDGEENEATNPDPRAPEHVNAHVTNREDVSPAVQPKPHQEQDEMFDLAEVVTLFVKQIDTYLRDQRVFQRCGVKIRQDRNTKGRTRILVSIQEGL